MEYDSLISFLDLEDVRLMICHFPLESFFQTFPCLRDPSCRFGNCKVRNRFAMPVKFWTTSNGVHESPGVSTLEWICAIENAQDSDIALSFCLAHCLCQKSKKKINSFASFEFVQFFDASFGEDQNDQNYLWHKNLVKSLCFCLSDLVFFWIFLWFFVLPGFNFGERLLKCFF